MTYSKNVATDDGGLGRGRQERLLWDLHVDRFETSLVQGNVLLDQAAQTVDDGGIGNRRRSIDVS